MDERRQKILFHIVEAHIKSKTPVSSKGLVREYNLAISPATVRNIMGELEEDGFILQPHTSAGRVPTEKAYRIYLEHSLSSGEENHPADLAGSDLKKLQHFLTSLSPDSFKQAAKSIAFLSDSAVFWAFNKNNLYYTGISNLLQQPEFAREGLIYDISSIIDQMDDIIANIFETVPKKEVNVLIGSDNPFGQFCSSVLAKYQFKNRSQGLVGILGPLRMDYQKNVYLIKQVLKSLEGK